MNGRYQRLSIKAARYFCPVIRIVTDGNPTWLNREFEIDLLIKSKPIGIFFNQVFFQAKNAQFAKHGIDRFGERGFQGDAVCVTIDSVGQLILIQGMCPAIVSQFCITGNIAAVDGSSGTYDFKDAGRGELTAESNTLCPIHFF